MTAAAAALYVASPIDLLPDVVPGVGGVDDLAAVLFAVRRLVTAAGYDVVR
ncbi:YkvA family protein, partial [Nitriliruptor sp.]|uniref:YkvA family protein n=1 Tax=Nitriliruptor sp. TaxID=2448056 RepID=UPI00349FD5E2